MSDRPVAFDLSRLVTRLTHTTPTGIDRVDLAYARWLFGGSARRFGVISTLVGPRVMRPSAVAALLSALELRWSDDVEPDADPAYRAAATRLGLPLRASPPCGATGGGWTFGFRASLLAGSRGVDALPSGTVYLHSSHLRLDRPERFAWLADRPDVRAVFFVHDLIPIQHPEFSRPGEDARHRVRLGTIGRHARGVIVNSVAVRQFLATHWSQTGNPVPPIAVAPLGVEPIFLRTAPAGTQGEAFFLICGTIEPRKNHAFLLQVWRRLAEAGGPVPKLVVAGRRGWESESVIDVLERAPFVREHVVEVSGLSTPGLARLMSLAHGVLMPSFAEGYGLPVAEALSLGTPVVASDIAVHREVAGHHATFVDPIDGPGWIAAVRALAAAPRGSGSHGAAAYRAPTWAAHLAIVADALASAAP